MCDFDSWCLEGHPREMEIAPGITSKTDGFEQIAMDKANTYSMAL